MTDENKNTSTVALSHPAMMVFANDWIAAWNRRDVDALLEHLADDAIFTSPIARDFTSVSVLRGKAALAEYWNLALERLSVLEFTLDHAILDPEVHELNIVYTANLNGSHRQACELMTFNSSGQQIQGVAFYGADIV